MMKRMWYVSLVVMLGTAVSQAALSHLMTDAGTTLVFSDDFEDGSYTNYWTTYTTANTATFVETNGYAQAHIDSSEANKVAYFFTKGSVDVSSATGAKTEVVMSQCNYDTSYGSKSTLLVNTQDNNGAGFRIFHARWREGKGRTILYLYNNGTVIVLYDSGQMPDCQYNYSFSLVVDPESGAWSFGCTPNGSVDGTTGVTSVAASGTLTPEQISTYLSNTMYIGTGIDCGSDTYNSTNRTYEVQVYQVNKAKSSLAIIDRVADGTISATGSSVPALVYGNDISTVDWISAATGSRTFDLTTPKYNVIVTGTVTGLTGADVSGNAAWMTIGLLDKNYLDGVEINQDPAITYASGQYGFGRNGGLVLAGAGLDLSTTGPAVKIEDGWLKGTDLTSLSTNAFDFKIVYKFLDGSTKDTRSIQAYWKPVSSDGWISLGTQNSLGYPINASATNHSEYGSEDQWAKTQVGVMVTHDAPGQTASISIANMKLAYENVLAGDANFDNMVNVSDLSLLAANYGVTSGATWAMGDFTGDGAVNVSDLSLLAANYGAGSAALLDFSADYAQVFGTIVSDKEANSTDNDTTENSTVCSSLGLSLIAGLAILGLMVVKLDE